MSRAPTWRRIENRERAKGQAFNMGGGPGNTLSLLELLSHLQRALKLNIPLQWDEWRPGDQPVFVCDLHKAQERLGWQPETDIEAGLNQLIGWVQDNKQMLASVLGH